MQNKISSSNKKITHIDVFQIITIGFFLLCFLIDVFMICTPSCDVGSAIYLNVVPIVLGLVYILLNSFSLFVMFRKEVAFQRSDGEFKPKPPALTKLLCNLVSVHCTMYFLSIVCLVTAASLEVTQVEICSCLLIRSLVVMVFP